MCNPLNEVSEELRLLDIHDVLGLLCLEKYGLQFSYSMIVSKAIWRDAYRHVCNQISSRPRLTKMRLALAFLK